MESAWQGGQEVFLFVRDTVSSTPDSPQVPDPDRSAATEPRAPAALADAFESFARASASLESSHASLSLQVDELTRLLQETEERLEVSLEENLRLHESAARTSRLEAMGRMAAEIAHEIRNPLGSLELTASLLRDDLADDPPRRELALSILEGIRTLTRVSGNLLTFTRSVSPRETGLEAEAVLARTGELIAASCTARGVALRIEAGPGLLFRGDPELMQQILLNLAQNALEATPAGGIVTISADRGAAGAIELRVRDTGDGIDRSTLTRVFDPFFTTKERGTGLGLPISHRLAHSQGARLELISEPGAGTTAVLTVPSAHEAGSKSTSTVPAHAIGARVNRQ